jgi:hypothetical protein
MKKEIVKARSETKASNAHCTIMTCVASASSTELEKQKHRTRQSVKTSAHLISHPMLVEQHNAETQAKALQAKESAEVEAQKAVSEALRETHIQEEMKMGLSQVSPTLFFAPQQTHTFPEPLSSYKWKDDLIALSGALGLKASGTITELSAQLRAHLAMHPDIQHNPCFSGLFLTCRHRVDVGIALAT